MKTEKPHQQGADRLIEQVLALDDRRVQAMLAADPLVLRDLLSPDLTYTHSDGRTDTRDSYLAALAEGRLRYRQCERETVVASVYGDVTVLEGSFRLQALDKGQEKAIRIHYLAVWVEEPARGCCLRSWASTLIEKLNL